MELIFQSPPAQWMGAAQAFQAFVSANYNQPNPHNQSAMASPPTIATSTTQPSGLSSQYRYTSNGSALTFTGGANQIFGGAYRFFPVAQLAASGGNMGAGKQAISWRVGATVNAQRVAVRVLGSTLPYRFIVDGQYVSTTGTTTSTTSGTNYIELDFGSKTSREIWVEGQLAQGFDGIAIAPTDSLSSVSRAPKRMLFIGDSFTEGSGATFTGDAYARVCSDMLGYQDAWLSGVGGSGYVATNSNTVFNYGKRLTDATTNGKWDAIIVAYGINDIGVSSTLLTGQVAYTLNATRLANPSAQIFVVGPWDTAAPAAPSAAYLAASAAIQAGIPANGGMTFLSPQGVSYTKADATHPNTAGHETLGDWLALAIKNAISA